MNRRELLQSIATGLAKDLTKPVSTIALGVWGDWKVRRETDRDTQSVVWVMTPYTDPTEGVTDRSLWSAVVTVFRGVGGSGISYEINNDSDLPLEITVSETTDGNNTEVIRSHIVAPRNIVSSTDIQRDARLSDIRVLWAMFIDPAEQDNDRQPNSTP